MLERRIMRNFVITCDHPRGRRRATAPDSRDALLDAAGNVFRLKGVLGGTIREISTQAGLSGTMIYYHFGGKDGLACALAGLACHDLLFALNAWDAEETLPLSCARLRSLASLLRDHLGEGSTLGCLLRDPTVKRFHRLKERLDRGQEDVLGSLRGLLVTGQQSGAIRQELDLDGICRWALSQAVRHPFQGAVPEPLPGALTLAEQSWHETLWRAVARNPLANHMTGQDACVLP